MNSIIEKAKQMLISSSKPHTIIVDNDDLFGYEEFNKAIEEAGFVIVKSSTDLDLRILFELQVRESNKRYLIIAPADYTILPDIELYVNYKVICLKDLIQNLEPSVLKGLSFNALSLSCNIKLYEDLGHLQTIKFVLENIYNLDFDTLTKVKAKERILNALIVVFLSKNNVNLPIAKYLTDISKPYFPELAKSKIDKYQLINFLNVSWSNYVISNQRDIDFEDPILNKNFSYLFLFEIINAIKISSDQFNKIPQSLRIGVFTNENENNDTELEKITQNLDERIQIVEDSNEEWFSIIPIIAKAKLKQLQSENTTLIENFAKLEKRINDRFQQFIDNVYWSLFTYGAVKKPILVTRILEYIMLQPHKKKCLIVIDGMNYWQGELVIKELQKKGLNPNMKTTFAYIPTITAWSRQAIFKGNKPDLSENNSKEEQLFYDYWVKNNYSINQIEFLKIGLYKNDDVHSINDAVDILGIVNNDLDDMMHGITLGNIELKNSTQQWVKTSNIFDEINCLAEKGFKVYITTDHGNICASGIGNLKTYNKIGTPSRSKRHLLFTNEIIKERFLEQNKNLNVGIRDNSVYLRNEEAFAVEGTKLITHGGSHFWEVLIPFIEII
ncbi:MAG: BREX-3 system phosphatase PglZ [bacterium]